MFAESSENIFEFLAKNWPKLKKRAFKFYTISEDKFWIAEANLKQYSGRQGTIQYFLKYLVNVNEIPNLY